MVYSKTLKIESLIDNLPSCEGYLIAYSGGADSTALLHLFSHTNNVRAIHVNHGLQNDADSWQRHCQQTCASLGIKLIVEQANLTGSSENSCRKARYEFFKKHLKVNEILLTAHHCQDQTETILLKLLRGTGIAGLTGIDKLRKFSQGFIARPLLEYSPQQLKEYLTTNGMSWVEDTSNNNNVYKRNYIRNEILPALQAQFPKAIENIVRSANNSRQSLNLLNHLCDFQGKSLPLSRLNKLPINLQSSLLYHWLSKKGLPTPDSKALKQITGDFINAASDKNPHYANEYYQLYRSNGAIYCIENFQIINSNQSFIWDTNKAFEFPNGCGQLIYSSSDSLQLVVKFNQKGQKIKPLNRNTKTVKNLFQENNVHLWNKLNTPFIYFNDELISLGHYWSHSPTFIKLISIKLKNLEI